MKRLLLLLLIFITPATKACEEAYRIEVTQFCTFLPANVVWFKFSTPEATTVSVITAGAEDGKMEIFSGSCDNLTFEYFDDNSGPFLMPQVTFTTEANTEYFVHVFDVELFEICIFNCEPLPVELIKFTADRDGTVVTLRWTTASETNNNYFTIYRSKDLKTWENIGRVVGSGNSNTLRYYTFSHIETDRSKVYYYKLTQTDFNGDWEQLEVIPLVQGVKNKKLITEVTIDGKPVPKDFVGIRIKIYDDGTIGKELITHP